MEELAGALHAIAQILENQLEEFADRFEPVFEAVTEVDPVTKVRRAFAELRRREQEKLLWCATISTELNLNGATLRERSHTSRGQRALRRDAYVTSSTVEERPPPHKRGNLSLLPQTAEHSLALGDY